jgi:hypothetical protein
MGQELLRVEAELSKREGVPMDEFQRYTLTNRYLEGRLEVGDPLVVEWVRLVQEEVEREREGSALAAYLGMSVG